MRTFKKLFLLAFLLLLLLPVLQHASGVVRVDRVNEHRAKVGWPAGNPLLAPAFDKGYTAKVEAYVADHFPLRDLLLRLHGQVEYSLLGVAREVIVGRDGWLSDKKLLAEHLPQLDQLDDDQVRSGILQLKRLQHWLAARDTRFLVVIVPLKPSIYPEYFPDKYQRRTGRSGLEKFQQALAANGVPFVDLHGEFRSKRQWERLYYQTDMHWNSVAVTLASEAIVNHFGREFLGRPIWHETPRKRVRQMVGEELRAIPLLFPQAESMPFWEVPGHFVPVPSKDTAVAVLRGTDAQRALLPPTLMFGNSFMIPYASSGYHNYFQLSASALDYAEFPRVLDLVTPTYKSVVLHIYETQLQYHIMPTGRAKAWSGSAGYWDKRIEALPLPPGFSYRAVGL
jgi:hypothetical protein